MSVWKSSCLTAAPDLGNSRCNVVGFFFLIYSRKVELKSDYNIYALKVLSISQYSSLCRVIHWFRPLSLYSVFLPFITNISEHTLFIVMGIREELKHSWIPRNVSGPIVISLKPLLLSWGLRRRMQVTWIFQVWESHFKLLSDCSTWKIWTRIYIHQTQYLWITAFLSLSVH